MTHNQNYRNILWDPMPKKIFQELQTIDTEIAWELCRADVISRLAGLDAFAVPFLDEAKVFEPFAVIGKVMLNGVKALRYLGHLPNLVLPCPSESQFWQEPQEVDMDYLTNGNGEIDQDFYYRVSNMDHIDGIKKGVKIHLYGTKAYDIAMNIPVGHLRFDYQKNPHLSGNNRIY